MTRALLWIVKHPKLTAIGVLLLISTVGGYMGYNMLTISKLETRVAVLEREVDSKDDQIAELKASVLEQNAAVDEWRAAANSRAAAAQEAQRQAQAARREADERVGQIKAENAQTCQEGIELINRVEGLYESNL